MSEASKDQGKVLVFDLGAAAVEPDGGAYGILLTQVLQVLESSAISPVPLAPPLILGIMNHHGRIVTVVDPAPVVGTVAGDLDTPETRVILLRQGQRSTGNVGLRVARVREIVPYRELKEADVPVGPCVSWVAQHGRRLINILRVEALLEGLAREFGAPVARESRQGVG